MEGTSIPREQQAEISHPFPLFEHPDFETRQFTPFENKIVHAISGNVLLQRTPYYDLQAGKRILTGHTLSIADGSLRQQVEQKLVENGQKKGFLTLLEDLETPEHRDHFTSWIHSFPLTGGLADVAQGNFLKRTLEGKDHCLDFTLTAFVLGKVYYTKDISSISIVPFHSGLFGKGGTIAAHLPIQHYGVVFSHNNQEFVMKHGAAACEINDIPIPQKGSLNERDLTASWMHIRQNYRRLQKQGIFPPSPNSK